MFVACGIWCLADGSNVSPLSEQAEGLTDCGEISVEIVGIKLNYADQEASFAIGWN